MSPRKTTRRRRSTTPRKPARRTSGKASRGTRPKHKPAARKRAVRKHAVRKAAARKRVVRKRAVRKHAVRKTAARKTVRGTTRIRQTAKVRSRRRSEPAPPAFAQRASASERQIVLFEMMRHRAAFLAAIQGLPPAAANEAPGGGWSVREIVLHLVTRDQARLRELESVLRGAVPSWKGVDDTTMARINADLMKPLLHHDWEESLRLLHRTRQQLLEAVETVPEEPEVVWTESHGFGWMLRALPPHDRHHAEAIKRWRATRGA